MRPDHCPSGARSGDWLPTMRHSGEGSSSVQCQGVLHGIDLCQAVSAGPAGFSRGAG